MLVPAQLDLQYRDTQSRVCVGLADQLPRGQFQILANFWKDGRLGPEIRISSWLDSQPPRSVVRWQIIPVAVQNLLWMYALMQPAASVRDTQKTIVPEHM